MERRENRRAPIKNGKMVKQAAPEIDKNGKMAGPIRAKNGKSVKMVNW